jgi:O-acetyl-ADP-ribose deacetylase (regulator of RNase III)
MAHATSRIIARQADITTLAVDAIVNAANRSLLGGGGVDWRHPSGFRTGLLADAASWAAARQARHGSPRPNRLPARYVIRAVGPRYRDGRHGEPGQLAGCYRNSLNLAIAHGVRTIAFPAISCGVYGYPIPDAARIAIGTVVGFLADDKTIQQVIFACFGPDVLAALETATARLAT